jgi:heptosyltransferase-2
MGDVVLTTSLFAFLKNMHPDSNIYFVTDATYSGLFKDDGRLCKVIGLEKKTRALDPQLLDLTWDRIVDLQNNRRSARVRKRLKPCAAIGRFDKKHFQRLMLLFTRMNLYGTDDHVVKRYIRAALENPREEVGVAPSINVMVDAQASDSLYRSYFSNGIVRPAIALIPFSAWKNKQWPGRYFITVGRYFQARGWNVLLLGGPDDREAALTMKKLIGERCSSMAGELSLYDTACLLTRCNLALGNDTGLSHLARACGVKTGVIFGSTTRHFGFFPFGAPPFAVFETGIFCRPCHPHGGNYCWLVNRPCLKRITPEAVIRGLDELQRTVT